MMHFFEWLEHSSFITWVDSSIPLSLMFEIMHYSGFFLLVGSMVLVDLRVIGLAARRRTPLELVNQLFPWMWTGLVMVVLSGFFMFAGDAGDFYGATTFRVKILVVLVAVIFGFIVRGQIVRAGEQPSISTAAKIVAFLSLVLWIGSILISVEVPAISGVG
jgi:hypothetical protein